MTRAPLARTAGVDLAAEPRGTALAVIDWGEGRARVRNLALGVADDAIVAAAASVDKIGIDCAFGWPLEFVEFVSAYAQGEPAELAVDGGMNWRRSLAFRETDRDVRRRTGRWPLSVATDRLGLTAMRCAGLLGRLQASGLPIDRSGAGSAVEVYPGASLRLWGFDTRRYRVDPGARDRLVRALADEAHWLELGTHRELMVASDDALDAVVAALAARSAQLGHAEGPPAGLLGRARREGWIALPDGPLARLLPGAGIDGATA